MGSFRIAPGLTEFRRRGSKIAHGWIELARTFRLKPTKNTIVARVRLRNDLALLAEWVSMSTLRAGPKGGSAEEPGPVTGGGSPAGEVTRPTT